MGNDGGKIIECHDSGSLRDDLIQIRVGYDNRLLVHIAFSIVLPINANGLEFVGQGGNFAQEILCGKAAFAQCGRWSVGGRSKASSRRHQFLQQAGHHHRVTGIIEFELINREELRAAEMVDSSAIPQDPHQRSELDKRAVVGAPGYLMPHSGQQMCLAHPKTAIEINTRFHTAARTRLAQPLPA